MPANTSPIYPGRVRSQRGTLSAANTNRDGTGTIVTVYTAEGAATATAGTGGNGSVVQSVTVVATGTTTAGVIRLYRHDGTSYTLLREILVTALTPSATIKSWTIPTSEGADTNGRLALNLLLEPGHSLRASTHNAETFHLSADIGDY